jgi:hypothetical protein
MFCQKCKCCMFSWWSGFFALATGVHIVRLIARAQVQIGDWVVPMGLSIAVAVVAGILSFIFCKAGCKSCGCSKGSGGVV